MKIKQLIIIILVVLISVIIVKTITSSKKPSQGINSTIDNVIYNESPGIINPKEINNISFTDISCKIEKDISTIEYLVTNNNNEDITINDYELVFKDKNGNIIGTIHASIPISIKANSSMPLSAHACPQIRDRQKSI